MKWFRMRGTRQLLPRQLVGVAETASLEVPVTLAAQRQASTSTQAPRGAITPTETTGLIMPGAATYRPGAGSRSMLVSTEDAASTCEYHANDQAADSHP